MRFGARFNCVIMKYGYMLLSCLCFVVALLSHFKRNHKMNNKTEWHARLIRNAGLPSFNAVVYENPSTVLTWFPAGAFHYNMALVHWS